MFVLVDGNNVIQMAQRAQDLLPLQGYYPNGYIVETDLGYQYRPPAPTAEQPVVGGAQVL